MATKKATTLVRAPTAPGQQGGKRAGAGRPPGARNKRTVHREEVAKLAAKGYSPLQFLVEVMEDEKTPLAYRIDVAKAAAKYYHPALASITHKGDPTAPVVTAKLSADEFKAIAAEMLKKV